MSRSALYFLIGALAVTTAALAYYFYQDRQHKDGLEINVNKGGISIEKK